MTSRYSQTEMILIARMSRQQFTEMMRGQNVDQALETRRQLQIALAEYSKHRKYDAVQERILVMTEKIAKWCRIVWLKQRLGFDLPSASDAVRAFNKAKIKTVKDEWEFYIKRRSY